MFKVWFFIVALLTTTGYFFDPGHADKQIKENEQEMDKKMKSSNLTIEQKHVQNCRQPKLISAFYGLEDGINRIYPDGMPLVFSHEVDWFSLHNFDFLVTTSSGQTFIPRGVTFLPAIGFGEWRTIVLLGNFGNLEDPPIKVKVRSKLLSRDRSISFLGQEANITQYDAGPSMVLAEVVPKEQWRLGEPTNPFFGISRGTNCPVQTKEIIRVTWDGGIRKPGGEEVDDLERSLYNITMEINDEIVFVTPFAIADLHDQDNNHKLCLNVTGRSISVSFPEGYLVDPAGHTNSDTVVNITTLTDCN